MAKLASNTQFFSKSPSKGTTRWEFSKPPAVVRGYAIDLLTMPLPNRWYAIALVYQASKYSIRVYGAGTDADLSLEDVDLQAVLAGGPIINVEMNTTDVAVATERFERAVSNVMHDLLAPLASVNSLWVKLATTDGGNLYVP